MSSSSVQQQQDKSGIWPALGFLRFLLSVIVLVEHCRNHFVTPGWFNRLDVFGPATLCFLVISGFSMAHSISHRAEGFYRRRIERVYPLYLAAFCMGLLSHLLFRDMIPFPSALQLAGQLVLLNGLIRPTIYAIGPTWSLAIEVISYALTPWFARLSTRHLLVSVGLIHCVDYPFRRWLKTQRQNTTPTKTVAPAPNEAGTSLLTS